MSDTTDPQQKDPLAVLEELLAKQKQGGASGAAASTPDAPVQPDPAAAQAEKQAEYERLQAEATARDAELLAAQEAKMQELKLTPQYQARISQTEEADASKQEASDGLEGFAIDQITTTRVPVTEDPV
jgi:hypothetical protein